MLNLLIILLPIQELIDRLGYVFNLVLDRLGKAGRLDFASSFCCSFDRSRNFLIGRTLVLAFLDLLGKVGLVEF